MGILNGLFGPRPPSDPLERALLAYSRGDSPIESLAAELREAQLVVLLEGDGGSVAEGVSIRPLAVTTPLGHPVVCAFTSIRHSQALRGNYPAWGTPVMVDFVGLLAALPAGHGIGINPGHDACAFWNPEDVDRFREERRLAA